MSKQLVCRIRKVSWESIRQMEDIEVNPQDGRNFWQIRNGYGKTTTLLLLRHIFTGNQPNTEELRHFKYNQTFGGDAKHGKFCVDYLLNRSLIAFTFADVFNLRF